MQKNRSSKMIQSLQMYHFSSNWSQLQFLLRTGGSQEGVGQAPQHQAASLRREPVLLLAALDQGYQATG